MTHIYSLVNFLGNLVEGSDMMDWAMVATVLVLLGYYFLRKVN